jgi:hypothetical protein
MWLAVIAFDFLRPRIGGWYGVSNSLTRPAQPSPEGRMIRAVARALMLFT